MTTPSEHELLVVDNQEASRYEIFSGSRLGGFLNYRIRPGRIVLVHAETVGGFEHQGLASRLAAWALEDARDRHLAVVPLCPFVASYVAGHPEYADLIAER